MKAGCAAIYNMVIFIGDRNDETQQCGPGPSPGSDIGRQTFTVFTVSFGVTTITTWRPHIMNPPKCWLPDGRNGVQQEIGLSCKSSICC